MGRLSKQLVCMFEVPYSYNQDSFYRGKKSKILIEIVVSHTVGL